MRKISIEELKTVYESQTVAETKRHFGVSLKTLYALLRKAEIPLRGGGRYQKIELED